MSPMARRPVVMRVKRVRSGIACQGRWIAVIGCHRPRLIGRCCLPDDLAGRVLPPRAAVITRPWARAAYSPLHDGSG